MKERTAAFHIERSASMPLNSFILAPRPETLALFRTTLIFWSSEPRRRMDSSGSGSRRVMGLVEWAPSGNCPQTASDAAGGKNRRRRQRSRRRSRRRARRCSRRRSRFIAPAGARPPSAPPSAFTQRHPRFSIDDPEHPRRTWEYRSQTDANAQTDGLYSLKRSTTARSVFAALMMASLPKTQTAPSRAMASRPTA